MSAGQRWSVSIVLLAMVAGCDASPKNAIGYISLYRQGEEPECVLVVDVYEMQLKADQQGVCYMPTIMKRPC